MLQQIEEQKLIQQKQKKQEREKKRRLFKKNENANLLITDLETKNEELTQKLKVSDFVVK